MGLTTGSARLGTPAVSQGMSWIGAQALEVRDGLHVLSPPFPLRFFGVGPNKNKQITTTYTLDHSDVLGPSLIILYILPLRRAYGTTYNSLSPLRCEEEIPFSHSDRTFEYARTTRHSHLCLVMQTQENISKFHEAECTQEHRNLRCGYTYSRQPHQRRPQLRLDRPAAWS